MENDEIQLEYYWTLAFDAIRDRDPAKLAKASIIINRITKKMTINAA